MDISLNDCLDHHYWLVGCNVEKWVNSELSTSETIKQKVIFIAFGEQLARFLRTFSPETPEEIVKAKVRTALKEHLNGNIFHYQNVTRRN